MATRTTAKTNTNECVIKCNPHQDLTNELLNYAIDYVVIDVDGNKINFSDVQGVR